VRSRDSEVSSHSSSEDVEEEVEVANQIDLFFDSDVPNAVRDLTDQTEYYTEMAVLTVERLHICIRRCKY
jgi:hypothetical protein